MFGLSLGSYEVSLQNNGLPELMLGAYRERAALAEHFETPEDEAGSTCCFAIRRRGEGWPFLVVTQRYAPAGGGFHPGALLAVDADRLFLGAGGRLLAYDLSGPARLWEDVVDAGFWSWSRYVETVLMSAELELAAWDVRGTKLLSRFVEPPWEYRVEGSEVSVDVMGEVTRLDLRSGRPV